MSAVWRWSVRLFALLAMLLFAALMVVFVVVTVNHFGQKEYVTDNVKGLPPVYVLTAVLVPCCAAFVGGFWMLFLDTFKQEARAQQMEAAPAGPAPALAPPEAETAPRRERLAQWARSHKPHWPRRAE
jgi:TRAP-type C4-dicarboxylate transport system permease small subunit